MGLGSILGTVGSIAAAPFTGGTSLAWLPAALGAGGAVADSLGHKGSAPAPAAPPAQSQPGGGSRTAEALALLGGLLGGRLLASHNASANVPPQLNQYLDLANARTAAQQPLFNAVNSGVYQMLPSYAKQGGAAMPGLPSPSQMPTPQSSHGGIDPTLLAILSALGGMGLGGAMTGTNPYGAIIDKLKNLGGGPPPFQGNKPMPGGTGLPIGNPGMPTFGGWQNPPDLGPVDPGMLPGGGGGIY